MGYVHAQQSPPSAPAFLTLSSLPAWAIADAELLRGQPPAPPPPPRLVPACATSGCKWLRPNRKRGGCRFESGEKLLPPEQLWGVSHSRCRSQCSSSRTCVAYEFAPLHRSYSRCTMHASEVHRVTPLPAVDCWLKSVDGVSAVEIEPHQTLTPARLIRTPVPMGRTPPNPPPPPNPCLFLVRPRIDMTEHVLNATSGCSSLRGANLYRADLRWARMRGIDLSEANLSDALLEHADFSRANLSGTCLDHALMEGSDLTGAVLDRASFEHADLRATVLSELREAASVSFRNAQLQQARIERSRLVHADFSHAQLDGALLNGVLLADSVWMGATLKATTFDGCYMDRANLRGVDMEHIVRMQPVVLKDADLRGASLRGLKLDGAQLNGADLRDAILVGTSLIEADLSLTKLQRADLRNATVMDAHFDGAFCGQQTDFTGASGLGTIDWRRIKGGYATGLPERIYHPAFGHDANTIAANAPNPNLPYLPLAAQQASWRGRLSSTGRMRS